MKKFKNKIKFFFFKKYLFLNLDNTLTQIISKRKKLLKKILFFFKVLVAWKRMKIGNKIKTKRFSHTSFKNCEEN